MELKAFIQTLETIAPPELAEEWDHTGLLIDPPTPRELQTVLLCVDLTEAVAREAIERKTDLIVAYHPIFFTGFNRLDQSNPQARLAMHLIQSNVAVYSPHTALDATEGGVNDWLASLFDGVTTSVGCARVVRLIEKTELSALAQKVRQQLHLRTLQIAQANNTIRTIALCAGSGIDALRGIHADCYLTGEMKHHDTLATVGNGTSVILCGHTETERGYLEILRQRLRTETNEALGIHIAKTDRAPLEVLT